MECSFVSSSHSKIHQAISTKQEDWHYKKREDTSTISFLQIATPVPLCITPPIHPYIRCVHIDPLPFSATLLTNVFSYHISRVLLVTGDVQGGPEEREKEKEERERERERVL
jgi:hypothetical protein